MRGGNGNLYTDHGVRFLFMPEGIRCGNLCIFIWSIKKMEPKKRVFSSDGYL